MPVYYAPRTLPDTPNHPDSPWTEERVDLLKKLWTDGQSASEIAAALRAGLSRSAVIGKAHRLGLARRAQPTRTNPPRRKGANAANAPAKRAFGPALAPVRREPYIPLPEPLTPTVAGVLDLQAHQCKWPMTGTGEGFSFCGREAEGVYCEAHAQRAHTAAPKKRKRPDQIHGEAKASGQWR